MFKNFELMRKLLVNVRSIESVKNNHNAVTFITAV